MSHFKSLNDSFCCSNTHQTLFAQLEVCVAYVEYKRVLTEETHEVQQPGCDKVNLMKLLNFSRADMCQSWEAEQWCALLSYHCQYAGLHQQLYFSLCLHRMCSGTVRSVAHPRLAALRVQPTVTAVKSKMEENRKKWVVNMSGGLLDSCVNSTRNVVVLSEPRDPAE